MACLYAVRAEQACSNTRLPKFSCRIPNALTRHLARRLRVFAADMATIINGPMGISESALMSRSAPAMSSAQISKRKELKDMLVKKLCEEHGNDAVRKAVIVREVEGSALLRGGKLTPDGLRGLERAVQEAVRATRPGPPLCAGHNTGRADPTKVWTAGELHKEVKAASNWTDVAAHRAKYYMIEQERKAADFEKRKVELRVTLAHQNAFERHKEVAARHMVQEEKKQIDKSLEEYYADVAREKSARERKAAQQKKDRDAMLAEQAARAAAAVRLRKLEDDELLAHLEAEKRKAEAIKEQKKKANDEYHRTTKLANQEAEKKREEMKQVEWAEEMKLNAQWKAMLDKQEADRNEQYSKLRDRIKKMQRAYEDNAGAEDAARLKAEEDMIERYQQQEERRLKEADAAKTAKREAMIAKQKEFNLQQQRDRKAKEAAERADEVAYAKTVRADYQKELKREVENKALRKATALEQTNFLNKQVSEQMDQAARDPGASEMTALEASLNRGLLVSLVQHKYPNPSVFN